MQEQQEWYILTKLPRGSESNYVTKLTCDCLKFQAWNKTTMQWIDQREYFFTIHLVKNYNK